MRRLSPSRRRDLGALAALVVAALIRGSSAPSGAAEDDAVAFEITIPGGTIAVGATGDATPDDTGGTIMLRFSGLDEDIGTCVRVETSGGRIGSRSLGAVSGCANLLAPILGCTELAAFEPRTSPAYEDYPANGELRGLEYRSYLRGPLVHIVQAAAERVRVLADGWSSGHGGPVGLGDMSECDGSIPGTSIGAPAHPVGTHTGGLDIDIAYFQTGTSDNRLRPVCGSALDGVDQDHCTEPPELLDVPRTALFIDALARSGAVRVIGVDGRIGPLLEAGLQALCDARITDCADVPLAYETSDTGLGWFTSHHHHMHVSFLHRAA